VDNSDAGQSFLSFEWLNHIVHSTAQQAGYPALQVIGRGKKDAQEGEAFDPFKPNLLITKNRKLALAITIKIIIIVTYLTTR
jgi:hypothetical protein